MAICGCLMTGIKKHSIGLSILGSGIIGAGIGVGLCYPSSGINLCALSIIKASVIGFGFGSIIGLSVNSFLQSRPLKKPEETSKESKNDVAHKIEREPQSEVEEEQQVEEVLTTLSSCQESSFHSSVLSPDIVSPRVTDEIRERGVIVREKQAKSEDISDDIMAFRAMIEREQSESIILQGSSGLSILLQLLATENAPTEFIHILQDMKKALAEDDNHVPIVPPRVADEIRERGVIVREKQAKSEDISDDIMAFRAMIEREQSESIILQGSSGLSILLQLLATENAPTEFIHILQEMKKASAEDDNHVPSEVEQRGGGEIVPLRVVNEIRRMANTATEKQAKSEDISDDIAAFRALIEREPLKSITISMWDGTFSTLLHLLAKQNAPVEFIRILVELSPASLNVQESGWVTFPNTPLLWAIANASNTAAAELLKHRQNLNLVANGNTALHLSVGKGYKNISEDGEPLNPSNHELARQLVAFGADCSIQNNEGNTPLHLACLRRDKEMIGILLAHPGIARSVNTRNHEGETPLDMLKKSYGEAFGLLQATVHAFLLDNEIFETTERAEIEKLFAPFTV